MPATQDREEFVRTVRIAMIGMGAANVASFRLLKAYGIDPGKSSLVSPKRRFTETVAISKATD